MTSGTSFLMYHELEMPGRELCQRVPGYVRYVLTAEAFRSHLARLREMGRRGLSVGEALRAFDEETAAGGAAPAGEPGRVAITFDDGCETDLLYAAPLLREANFNATFYVVTGLIGERGYMSERQLRELAAMNFEIGSHSHTHSYLPDLDAHSLRAEVAGSKERLEQITGRRVEHFSCPGGRWDRRVAEAAQEAGYASVATSRFGENTGASDRFSLRRVAVMRGTTADEVERLARARGQLRRRAQGAALGAAKKLLGNSMYEKIRSTVVGPGD